MLQQFLIGAVGTFIISGSVLAADLQGRGSLKDMPVVAPPFTWQGFYIGVHGGYSFATDSQFEFQNDSLFNDAVGDSFNIDARGGFGGGQLGYNFQRGNFVFGIEGSISGAHIKDTIPNQFIDEEGTLRTTLDGFATIVGRLGYARDRTLLYAKAGYAVADISFRASDDTNDVTFHDDETFQGYVVGVGLEYALSNNWIIGVEYNYMDLGSGNFRGEDSDGDLVDLDADIQTQNVLARLSYKFGPRHEAALK